MMTFAAFDQEYLDRLRAGDCETQQHFFAYFGQLVRVKASKRVNNPVVVEDVCQETFARALAALRKNGIQQPERLGAFVNSVCTHVLQEFYRSRGREAELKYEDEVRLPDTAPGTFEQISVREQRERVHRVLQQLSAKDRALIQAVFIEERDKDEVCRELGVTREYLRVLICRAKQNFKALYVSGTKPRAGEFNFSHARRNRAAFVAVAA